jgi:hypothetical protein
VAKGLSLQLGVGRALLVCVVTNVGGRREVDEYDLPHYIRK